MMKQPTVSVVIPTLGRSSLKAAVDSATRQSPTPLEVIIGADTVEPLSLPDDKRIRVVRCGPRGGGNAARTAALTAARGDLVALLDDDDVWDQNKLKRQLDTISELKLKQDCPWVISSRVVDTDGAVRPDRLVSPAEHPLAYLFEKRSVRGGVGKFHTSTLLFPRWIAEEVPFDSAVRFNQDPTWYIQVLERFPDTVFVHHPEPLTVVAGTDGSISRTVDWRQAAEWCATYMADLEPRWRGDYALMDIMGLARRSQNRSEHVRAFIEAFKLGRPGWPAIVYAIAKLSLHNAERLRRSASSLPN